jgi:hypothetical protein
MPGFNITKSRDKLTEETWGFTVLDTCIILNSYWKSTRQSPRHKWQVLTHYDRLNTRDSTLKEADVPWTEELRAEALALYVATLKVGRWYTEFGGHV